MKQLARTLKYLALRWRSKGFSDVVSLAARKLDRPEISMALSRLARRKFRNEPVPALKAIQIETLGYCNYKCSFCPTNQIDMPKGRMSTETFSKIIDQLRDFDGEIRLYLRNEPFLDKRMVDFARMAKEQTAARILIQTNGSLLSRTLAEEVVKYATVQVNDYSDGEVSDRISSFADELGIVVADRRSPKGLSNRAGNLPNVESKQLDAFCTRPFEQMYIAYDGRAVLCCQDWRLEEIFGDASTQSLEEIWGGEAYVEKRRQLLRLERNGLCAKCDHPGI